MSFLVGLRASSSRVSGATSIRGSGEVSLRSISTVQEADRRVGLMKKRPDTTKQTRTAIIQQSAGKSAQRIDAERVILPILENITMTPFKFTYLFQNWFRPGLGPWESFKLSLKERGTWLWSTSQRALLTSQTSRQMQEGGTIDPPADEPESKSFLDSVRNIGAPYRTAYIMKSSAKAALDMYTQYNRALASGNVSVIRQTSSNSLLLSGEKIAKAKKNMKWELAEEPQLPKVMWVRHAPLDGASSQMFGQVCFKFDTKQRLTTYDKGVRNIRVQDVTEYIVFKYISPVHSVTRSWRMMERVQAYPPIFALQGEARRKVEEFMAKNRKIQGGSL